MSYTRRVVGSLALVLACLALTSCGSIPFIGGGVSTAPTVTPATTGTPAPTAATTPTPPPHTKFARSPRPKTYDPLLASGKWGFHSRTKYENKDDDGVTMALHQNLEKSEVDNLLLEQEDLLLDVFEDSAKVNKIIRQEGGHSSEASYGVVAIEANDDVAVDTPWVTIILRADFPTNDGLKGLACYVYRQKTRDGLDNRPFVARAIVGYVDADGAIHDPVVKRF
jgi:hypothetical protein